MNCKSVLCLLIGLAGTLPNLIAQSPTNWHLTDRYSIIWYPDAGYGLPYKDNIEMAGKQMAAIVYYEVDSAQNLHVKKDLIFPQLRTFNKSNEPDWKKYRAYFRRMANEDLHPILQADNLILKPSKVDSIEIGGVLTFYYAPVEGWQLTKTLFPAMNGRYLVEEWRMKNVHSEARSFSLSPLHYAQTEPGYKGTYSFTVQCEGVENMVLGPNKETLIPVYYGATLNEESPAEFDMASARTDRLNFLQHCRTNMVLQTPDPVLNRLFYFAKIRAAESIYHSSLGLIHSPGGGNYYVGIWANDQVEYSGPFFPYLGYPVGNEAAYNTYRKFAQHIPTDSSHIPYAFEVDGNFPMEHLDRGDAAMIAYGASLYLLNRGNQLQAAELWPLIEWSLAYCQRMQHEAGAVQSESDEMEGRIETGDANLSTSTLYYGGLKYAAPIAQALGYKKLARTYRKQQKEMEAVIEDYFGADMEGLETYRYFDGNQHLRHWICLPLTMGITTRKEGTLKALFGKLWTDNGILVEYNPDQNIEEAVFWDRATLYALRGALKVGATKLAMEKLTQYSTKRLLGDHVPYPVEAYPENNMKHLSAESALYCRIFVEGLLGLEPDGFGQFTFRPNMPAGWNRWQMQGIFLGGKAYDVELERTAEGIQLRIRGKKELLVEKVIQAGDMISVDLK